MDLLHALLLAIIQGITEFFPVSSSGHLLLLPQLTGFKDQGLAMDAALHLATALAIFVYFRMEWIALLRKGWKSVLLRKIIVASIPAVLFGVLFDSLIEHTLRSPWVVVTMLIIVAGLMWWVEDNYTQVKKVSHKQQNKSTAMHLDISWPQALIIGIAQTLALIPGTSRSGITIVAGMWQNVPRAQSAHFSFLLGAPLTLGAGLIKLLELSNVDSTDWNIVGFSMILTFVIGLAAMHWLLKFLERNTLKPFAIYRVVLAIGVIALLLL